MFIKASSNFLESIMEYLPPYFATNDEYNAFMNVLETKVIEPTLFSLNSFYKLIKRKKRKML